MAKKKGRAKKAKFSKIKELKKLEKKYVSVIEQNSLNQELSRLNKLIITFGVLSAIALLVIIFLVFVVFEVGKPLGVACAPYVAQQLYYKQEACNQAMSNVLDDYNAVISGYESVKDQLSPQCREELMGTGIYERYGQIVARTKGYVVS